MNEIIARIEREAGVPGVAALLAERVGPTDLQSLLLAVFRARSARRKPADLLEDFRKDRFVLPSPATLRRLHEWEGVLLGQLPDEFEPIVLSPVCPLGTSSVVASLNQDWAVSTARNTEVVSDPTNVMALECALRRRDLLRDRERRQQTIHLATSHRVVRAQKFDAPGFVAHFALFALCSAGRGRGGLDFEVSALRQHALFHLSSLSTFVGRDVQLFFKVTDFGDADTEDLIEAELFAPIRAEIEGVECTIDRERTAGRGYYPNLCFQVNATGPSGEFLQLADGGAVPWTEFFLSDSKERLFISGIGSERVCTAFPGAH